MATIKALDFLVNTQNLQDAQLVEKTYAEELSPNEVLLRIDKFSFTSNNITYGVAGERMNYWKFFPTRKGFGIIPAWGFADVMISNHPDIQVGQRFYGYYPMSSHLVVTVNHSTKKGFVDAAEHRQALPTIYNFYTDTAQDHAHTPQTEDLISLFRPLFVTSFLIDDHLSEQNFYGATQIVLTSASSKTAQALAFLLARRKKAHNLNFNLVGLTSKTNLPFVEQLGWYDQTLAYEQIEHLDEQDKFVVVDFAGNHNTQFRLQSRLKDHLLYNCLVGLADWQNMRGEPPLPRKGEFFFAPTYAEKRQQLWGLAEFQQKVSTAWQQFVTSVHSHIAIGEPIGADKLEQLYLDMLNGSVDPRLGNMVSLSR